MRVYVRMRVRVREREHGACVHVQYLCTCTAYRGAEQALGRLAYEMAGLARHNPHAGAHLATAASQMLALYR